MFTIALNRFLPRRQRSTPVRHVTQSSGDIPASEPIDEVSRVVALGEQKCQDESDDMCAICFEDAPPYMKLPCACKLKYCVPCWDQAVVASIRQRGGLAQCPSCRSPLKVEYDAGSLGLIFKKGEARERQASLAEIRTQLYEKSKPVQIQLLRDFGLAQKGLNSPSCCEINDVDLASTRQVSNETVSTAASEEMSVTLQPKCVCGDSLELVGSHDRITRMLDDTEPNWRARCANPTDRVTALAKSSIITCELCRKVAMGTGFVWTCKKGPHTAVHPAAYDVCEDCFTMYSS